VGAIWLLSMPDVLVAAGVEVDLYPGWEVRARSSGGYDALLGVQVHHTASDASPASDMAWMWENSPDEPIGAVHLARDGKWTVGCAGATNTSGKGGPMQCSGGTVPLDAGNRYLLSIEAANNGVGQPWPKAQTDSYVAGVRALCDAYGLTYGRGDVNAHFEWTSRKIDPAGPSPYATGSQSWNMDAFRADLSIFIPPQPPDPPPGDDQMYTFLDLTDVDAVLGGYMDSRGIAAVVEWLSPPRYAAMANLGVPTVELDSSNLINCTLLGEIPNGLTAGNFARVIT
jgi:hypothetical protein